MLGRNPSNESLINHYSLYPGIPQLTSGVRTARRRLATAVATHLRFRRDVFDITYLRWLMNGKRGLTRTPGYARGWRPHCTVGLSVTAGCHRRASSA